ncbi:hypothetical protein VTN00DRAFT_2014 [Thermoascus crustaceus]|uniref:uncharacterized protein n=1 Tax=Thermoascus crustaceus TaxID=5088 RepID=UPI003744686B
MLIQNDLQTMGFPTGTQFKGTEEQEAILEHQYLRKAKFTEDLGAPIWNGEFGPVYSDPNRDADAAAISHKRYTTCWANSYASTTSIRSTAQRLGHAVVLEVEAVLKPLVRWIDKVSPTAKDTYPGPWGLERHVQHAVFQTFLYASFEDGFAGLFKGMDEKEPDALAHSFHFDGSLQLRRIE